jgi:regulator of RNase E activity RraA
VVADANGILSIPPAHVAEAIELACDVGKKEDQIKNQILSGYTIFDIFKLEQFVIASQERSAKPK